jgi:hypothetical protein
MTYTLTFRGLLTRIYAVFITLSIFVGCASSSSSRGSESATIGAEGGELVIGEGDEAVSLTVPAGALEEDTKITAKPLGSRDGVSSIIQFKPSGLIFGDRATVRFGSDAASSTGTPIVVYTSPAGERYPVTAETTSDGGLEAKITHFSSYGVVDQSFNASTCVPNFDGRWLSTPTCKYNGSAGPLLWGITEFGLTEPYIFISVHLTNTTTDLVHIVKTTTTSENFFGPGGFNFSPWHVPELDYHLSISRDRRANMEKTPMRKYLGAIGGYGPTNSLASFGHLDRTMDATFEVCFEWIQFNEEGVVDQGTDCISYTGEGKAEEEEVIPDGATCTDEILNNTAKALLSWISESEDPISDECYDEHFECLRTGCVQSEYSPSGWTLEYGTEDKCYPIIVECRGF